MLQNEYLFAQIGVKTAENEPLYTWEKMNNIYVYVEFYESYDQLNSTNCSWTSLGSIKN